MIQMLQEMRKDTIFKMKKLSLILLTLISFSLQTAKASDDSNPLFVTITMRECHSCQKLKPVIEELKNEYNDRVTFITLDVSSKASLEESQETAIDLGIENFFNENKKGLPAVGIVCPGGTKIENVFAGETEKEIYKEALNKLLLDTSKLCSL